jgi:hypothetical protein
MRGTVLLFALIVVGFILLVVKVQSDRNDAQNEPDQTAEAR